ncbi:hypothetical protein PR048_000542 [Dryococelus australis]|uniref:Uncharacterized protein n=1 Tax=Dryococelus australis TaxID=614101 RepID=A0ABQ9IEY8_9NEOP|nr:hypothetical protein PR048_000542 [Dryococelus australis]
MVTDDRRIRAGRRPGQRFIVEWHTAPKRGVMVWGATSYDCRIPLVVVEGTRTAQRYVQEILRPCSLPFMVQLDTHIFQQDNTRSHTVRRDPQTSRPPKTFGTRLDGSYGGFGGPVAPAVAGSFSGEHRTHVCLYVRPYRHLSPCYGPSNTKCWSPAIDACGVYETCIPQARHHKKERRRVGNSQRGRVVEEQRDMETFYRAGPAPGVGWRRNEGAEKPGDARESLPTSGIVQHDSHFETPEWTGSPWWEASSLTARPPCPPLPPSRGALNCPLHSSHPRDECDEGAAQSELPRSRLSRMLRSDCENAVDLGGRWPRLTGWGVNIIPLGVGTASELRFSTATSASRGGDPSVTHLSGSLLPPPPSNTSARPAHPNPPTLGRMKSMVYETPVEIEEDLLARVMVAAQQIYRTPCVMERVYRNIIRRHHALLTFYLDELGSNPCGAAPGFSHVGIVSDSAVDRRVFSGISCFSQTLHSQRIPVLVRIVCSRQSGCFMYATENTYQLSALFDLYLVSPTSSCACQRASSAYVLQPWTY